MRPTACATTERGRNVDWQAEQKSPHFPVFTPFRHPGCGLHPDPFPRDIAWWELRISLVDICETCGIPGLPDVPMCRHVRFLRHETHPRDLTAATADTSDMSKLTELMTSEADESGPLESPFAGVNSLCVSGL